MGREGKTPALLLDIHNSLLTENNRTECTNTNRALRVNLAKTTENFHLKPGLSLYDRATRAHLSYFSGAFCYHSSAGQRPLKAGMPSLGLVPMQKETTCCSTTQSWPAGELEAVNTQTPPPLGCYSAEGDDLRKKIQWPQVMLFPLPVIIVHSKRISMAAVVYVISIIY